MARTGRPKAEIQRDDRIIVRLTPEEHAIVREFARARKCTFSQILLDGVEALKKQELQSKDASCNENLAYQKLLEIQNILKDVPPESE